MCLHVHFRSDSSAGQVCIVLHSAKGDAVKAPPPTRSTRTKYWKTCHATAFVCMPSAALSRHLQGAYWCGAPLQRGCIAFVSLLRVRVQSGAVWAGVFP